MVLLSFKQLSKLSLGLLSGLLLAGALLLFLAGPPPALAATCSVPGTHATIQAAINDVNCNPINIGVGTFNQNLVINRSLTLQGAGQTATIINGGGTGRPVTINGTGVVVNLNNLRLTNGNASSASTPNLGGGILVATAARLHGTNLQLDNNLASAGTTGFGGGIAINNASAYLTNTVIYANTANQRSGALTGHGRGGGLYLNSGTLHLVASQVLTNLAAYRAATNQNASGGGLHVGGNAQVYLSGNTWQANIARGSNSQVCDLAGCAGGLDDEGGGAIGVSFPTGTAVLTITGDIFTGNIANDVNPSSGNNSGRGGAISLHTTNTGGQVQATLTNVTMSQNIAARKSNGSGEEGRGGAIYARHTRLSLNRAKLYNNQAAATGQGSGGGIYMREPLAQDFLDIINAILAGNTAAGNGTGAQLHAEYTNLTANNVTRIIHSTFADDNINPHEAIFYFSSDASDTLALTNTIVASHTVGIQNVNATGKATARYMLFYNNGDNHPSPGTTAFPDTTGWVAGDPDPRFVNPPANDYHLRNGSPAINQGINAGINVDYDGDTRPQDAGFDIGADEYTSVTPPPQKVYLPLIIKN